MDGFVEREFSVQDLNGANHLLKVIIGKPFQKGEDNWVCRAEIHDNNEIKEREMYGVDSMQALRSALIIIEAEIGAYQRKYGGRITFADQDQLWI